MNFFMTLFFIFVPKFYKMKQLISKLKSFDYIIISYCLITGIYISFGYNQLEHMWNHLILRFVVILFSLLIVYYSDQNKFIQFLRNFYPLVLLSFFYSETGYFNQLIFSPFDSYLVQLEGFIFGIQPSIEFSKLISNQWFSELMHFGYFSYYLIIFAVPLLFYLKEQDKFERSMFIIILSFSFYYILFFLLPSIGPQFYFDVTLTSVPEGFLFDKIMRIVIETAETQTGAFPSSHIGITIILLILIYKHFKPFFKYLILVSVILTLSTVYLKAHYIVDVLAGFISGIGFYYIGYYSFKLFEKKQMT